ncbi:MAG: FliM/FliN family flagellar motor C-terminal domain-containing protein [Pirellulales bacterium]|nr:FliM/FliN family flagellar motor C-terminal domain-containing protein [Pirellulales bacterium]
MSQLDQLPNYTRSLLKVEVPVSVKLAGKKQTVDEILRLGAGSIIQFDKGCDEMLEMEAGEQTIAEGEAVKVGDKFGLRITSIILPDERFETVRNQQRPAE